MTDAKTPRTDELLLELNEGRVYATEGPVVNLCHQLETELSALQSDNAKLREDLVKATNKADEQGRYAVEMFDALKPVQIECAKLREECEALKKDAAKIASGEEHIPLLLVPCGEKLAVIPVAIPEEDRSGVAGLISALLRGLGADEYVFIHEGWAAEASAYHPGVKISSLPLDDRQEILLFMHVVNGIRVACWQAEIRNTPAGRFVEPWKKVEKALMKLVPPQW